MASPFPILKSLDPTSRPRRRRPGSGQPHRLRHRARLSIESLEDRRVPATFMVTNLADSGAGTLRDAITQATDGNDFYNTITFQSGLSGNIDLTTFTNDSTSQGPSFFVVHKSLTIEGPTDANDEITLQAGASARFFTVAPEAWLHLDNLNLSGGIVFGSPGGGAGLGGAILNDQGILDLESDTFQNNAAIGGSGGGDGMGGAVYSEGTAWSIYVFDSTFSGNEALGGPAGGGSGSGTGIGGAIAMQNDTLGVHDSTFVNNAAQVGAGIDVVASNGWNHTELDLYNSLLSDEGTQDVTISSPDGTSAIINGDSDLFSTTPSDAASFTNSTITSHPGIGTIGFHGGSTQTVPLLEGSPAIGHANPSWLETPAVDQRGFARSSTAPDIGADQKQPASLTVLAGAGQAANIDTIFAQNFQVRVMDDDAPLAGATVLFGAPANLLNPNPNLTSGTFTNGEPLIVVTTDANGIATAPAYTANGNSGSYSVLAALFANGAQVGGTVSIPVTNALPLTASAGGPYTISQGSSLTLNASPSSDPNGGTLTYTWNINGHADAATGASPTLSWAQLQALGLDTGPGMFMHTIRLTVSDGIAADAYSAATLFVTDTPPTASIVGLPVNTGSLLSIDRPSVTDTAGTAFSLAASVTDVSAAETAAGFNELWQAGGGINQMVVAGHQLSFNGSNPMTLPYGLINGAASALTIDITFQTTSGGVLVGYQNKALGSAPGDFVPALYVGSDGRLYGELWDGAVAPMQSGVAVNDGQVHHAVLSYANGVQTLNLDGTVVGTINGSVDPLDMAFDQLGTGDTTAWPGGTGGFDPFVGTINNVAISNGSTPVGTWSFTGTGGGQVSFTPFDVGIDTIGLVATDMNGGTGTASGFLTINDASPTPMLFGLPTNSVPAGSPVTLTAAAADSDPGDAANPYTYAWQVTDSNGNTIASTATGSQALSFNGTNQYVNLGNPSDLNINGDITLEAWVKPGSTGGLQDIIAHGYQLSPTYAEDYLRIADGDYEVGSWDGNNAVAEAAIPAGDVGQWVHLAGVYNGSEWQLYRDGVLVATSGANSQQGALALSTGTVPQGYGSNDWAIGAAGDDSERFFQGQIADVNIWSTGRSAAQVVADMGTAIPANQSGLVASYQLGQASGGTVSDATGNGNTGVLGGSNPSDAPTVVPGIAPGSVLTFTPPDIGTYTVTVTATDANGGSGTTTSTINAYDVAPTPTITGLSGGSDPVGSPISLTATATDPASAVNAAGYQYLWQATNADGQTTIAGQDLVLTGNNPVSLPSGLISGVTTSFIIDVSFTTTHGGVILGYQDAAPGTTPANWVPALYVGTDGHLYGEIFDGTLPMQSTTAVNDGTKHSVELSYARGVETLKLDETIVGSLNSPLEPLDMTFDELGTGWTTNWQAGNGGLDPFIGTIQSVAISNNNAAVGTWSFPGTGGGQASFTPNDVGTDTIALLAADKNGSTGVTSTPLTVTEVAPTPTIDGVPTSSVAVGTPITLSSTITSPSPVVAAAGFNQVWEVDGNTEKTVAAKALSFDGNDPMTLSPDLFTTTTVTITLTFQTTRSGVLLGYQSGPLDAIPGSSVPAIYVGVDGRLYAQLFEISTPVVAGDGQAPIAPPIDPIRSTARVDDGASHTVTLTVAGTMQTLTLDGTVIGGLHGDIQPVGPMLVTLGTGYAPVPLGIGYSPGWPGLTPGYNPFVGTIGSLQITTGDPPSGILSFPGAGGNDVTFIGPDPETFTISLRAGDKNGGTGVTTATITTTSS